MVSGILTPDLPLPRRTPYPLGQRGGRPSEEGSDPSLCRSRGLGLAAWIPGRPTRTDTDPPPLLPSTPSSPVAGSLLGCRLVDLVVKASALRAADTGFDSSLRCGHLSGLSYTSDFKLGAPVSTLITALAVYGQRWEWLPGCQYTVT